MARTCPKWPAPAGCVVDAVEGKAVLQGLVNRQRFAAIPGPARQAGPTRAAYRLAPARRVDYNAFVRVHRRGRKARMGVLAR